jgi:predicted O-methyltransferase YrrM
MLGKNTPIELNVRLEELRALIDPISGWLHHEAGCELYRRARFEAPTSTIVEIGSWKGRSTAWLGFAMKDRGEGCVYAVDTWLGSAEHRGFLAKYEPGQLRDEFLENMRRFGLTPFVEAIESSSVSAAREWEPNLPIGLLFIDGAHDYPSVRADFEFWSPMLAPGGFLVLDDVPSLPGPLQVAYELPRWFGLVGSSVNQVVFQKNAYPSEMNPLLLELWREKHPHGVEQFTLEFERRRHAVEGVLFVREKEASEKVDGTMNDGT